MLQHVYELSLGDAVAVHDDTVRLKPARALVEHYQQLLNHAAHLMNYLLSAIRNSAVHKGEPRERFQQRIKATL